MKRRWGGQTTELSGVGSVIHSQSESRRLYNPGISSPVIP